MLCVYMYIIYIYIYIYIYTHTYIHTYIYIYICREREREREICSLTRILRRITDRCSLRRLSHREVAFTVAPGGCNTVDFRNFIVFFGPRPWHIEIRHRVKKTSTIYVIGFETLKLKIRRLKLWKPTVQSQPPKVPVWARVAENRKGACAGAGVWAVFLISNRKIQSECLKSQKQIRCLFVRTVSNFKLPGSRPQKQI